MAPTNDARWDRWRNAIHTLYVVKNKPLEGKHGVMGIMKEKHNFEASKPQYERRLAKWGFIKKTTKESWQVGFYKVKKRKKEGKETLVYRDGVLIPPDKAAKEISRQGHMTALESIRMANGPSPRTPADFSFRTPSENSVVRLELEGLPVFQFLRTIQGFADLFLEPTPSFPANNKIVHIPDTAVFPESAGDSALVGLSLPLSTLENGTAQASTIQQACRMAFSVSNNLSGNVKKSNVYQWLERQGLPAASDLTIFRGPTGEALLENFFRMAVEMGHFGAVKQLLAAGADPNESLCSAPGCAVMLTPLQYACLVGNTPLVRVLHNAGALVKDNPFGWQGSILVLAILRYRLQPQLYLHKNHHSCFGDNDCRSNCYFSASSLGVKRSAIIELVNVLISFGAEVNDPGRWASECEDATAYDGEYYGLAYMLAFEAHSPLTIAAAYNITELVEVFLQKGADVHYYVNGVSSALQQSICPFHRVSSTSSLHSVAHPPPVTIPPSDPDTVDTVKALLRGGASPDRREPLSGDRADEPMPYSPLDHALGYRRRVGVELANILLSNGASLTIHTLRLAYRCGYIDIFGRVLSVLSSISESTLLEGKCLGIFGLKYSKDTFSERDVYKALILEGLDRASVVEFRDLLLSNPFPDVLSDYLPTYLEPPDDHKSANLTQAKLNLLRRVNYLGATARFIEVLRFFPTKREQKVRSKPTATRRRIRSAACCSLRGAIDSRDWSLVSQLKAAGAPLCGNRHIPPLVSLLVAKAPLETVQSFLEDGADPNVGPSNDVEDPSLASRRTPLVYMITEYYSEYREALIHLLLQHGANPTLLTPPTGPIFMDTALSLVMVAIERHVFSAEISCLTHATLRSIHIDSSRHQPLRPRVGSPDNTTHSFHQHHDLHTVKILLDHGADSGRHPHPAVLYSPLQLAAYRGGEECVRLLLDRGADPNDLRAETFSQQKPIYYDGKDYIGSPIQSAVVARNLPMVDMLLRSNAHPDLTTPVSPHTPLQIACRKKLDAIAHLLVEYGANINAPPAERHGATALQFAAINCRLELAQMLVQKGANVNAPPATYDGRTALEGAAEHGRIDMVQYLVNAGADISGDQYERALERARSHGYFATWNLLVSYLS